MNKRMIAVEVINTFLLSGGKEFVILLSAIDENDNRTLPISIGQLEAHSIAIQLNHLPFPRPLTHDLIKVLLNELGVTIVKTEICQLKNDTFYATIHLKTESKTVALDSRPSDAIALALRFEAPIFVLEEIMDEAGVIISEETPSAENSSNSINYENDGNTEPTIVEILQKQLAKAISEERYEEAAKIRDEIIKNTKIN